MHTMFTCNSLSAANSFFFNLFLFFLPIKHTNNNTSRLCFLLDHLFLSHRHTHTYLYLYLETRADTVRRLLVLGFVFYKEYGSFVEKIPWRRRIESKYM